MKTDTSADNLRFDPNVDCNDESAPNQQEVIASLSHSLGYRISDSALAYARTRFIRSSDLVDKFGLAQALLTKATNDYALEHDTLVAKDLSTIGKAVRSYLTTNAQQQLAILEEHTHSRIAIIKHLVAIEQEELLKAKTNVNKNNELNPNSDNSESSSSSSFNSSSSSSSSSDANAKTKTQSASVIASCMEKATTAEELEVNQAQAADKDIKALPKEIATSPITKAILEASRLASRFEDVMCVEGVASSASVAGTESIFVMPSSEDEHVDFADYTSVVHDNNFGVEAESLKVTIAEFGDQILEILAKVGYISASVTAEAICKQTKYDASIVTNVDLAISEYLSTALEELTGYPVVSEESIAQFPYDVRKDLGCYWLIDPLDGTKGFALGNNHYCHMISFIQHNESVFSCIYVPRYQHQFVIGGKGQGVYTGQCHCEFYQDLDHDQVNHNNLVNKNVDDDLAPTSEANQDSITSDTTTSDATTSTLNSSAKFLSLDQFKQLVNTSLEQAFSLQAVVHQSHLRSCGWDYIQASELHQASVYDHAQTTPHANANTQSSVNSNSSSNSNLSSSANVTSYLTQAQVLSGVNLGVLDYAYEQDFLQILNYYKNTIRPFYNTYLDNSLEDLVNEQAQASADASLDAKAKATRVEFRYNLLPNLAPLVFGNAQDRDDSVVGQGLHTFRRLGDFSVAANLEIDTAYNRAVQGDNFNHGVLAKTVLQNYKLSYQLVEPKLVLLTGSAGITLVGKQSLALKSANFVNEVKTSAGLKTFEVVTRRDCCYLLGGLMSEWDLAPAMCLLRELGGVVFDLATAKYLPPMIFNKRHLDVLPCLMVTDPVHIPYIIDLMELAHLQVPQHINSYLLAKCKKHQASSRFLGELYDGYRLIDPV